MTKDDVAPGEANDRVQLPQGNQLGGQVPDDELTPMGAAIKHGQVQMITGRAPAVHGQRQISDDGAGLRGGADLGTAPPRDGTRPPLPDAIKARFAELKKLKAPADVEEEDNLSLTSEDCEQAGREMWQRESDAANGYIFKNHVAWKEWNDQQPGRNGSGVQQV